MIFALLILFGIIQPLNQEKVNNFDYSELDQQELYNSYSSNKYTDTTNIFTEGTCWLKNDTLQIRLRNKERFTRTNLIIINTKASTNLVAYQMNTNCVLWRNIYEPIFKEVEIPSTFNDKDSLKLKINCNLTYEDTVTNSIDTLKVWGWTRLKIKKE